MQKPNGGWRVAGGGWYAGVAPGATGSCTARVLDWLSIAAVERILAHTGVDRDQLTAVRPKA